MLIERRRRNKARILWTVVLGVVLGGLFTKLSELFLPESAARDFLTTSVAASVGPVAVDIVVVALTLGPFVLTVNVLTVVGVGLVALVARSLI